jgi:hypothetical protein
MPLPVEIPLSKEFSAERILEIDNYCKDRLKAMKHGLREIREEKIQAWRKIYYGTPREKTKSFPWQGASNIVIQLVGSFVDQATAKMIMGTIASEPLWVVGLLGKWDRAEKADEQREAVEEWLAFTGLEPSRLNLLEKYVIWVRTIVRYGFGVMKLMPELTVEQVAQTVDESGRVSFRERTRHDGPVALPLMFEDFLIPATARELERYPIVAQRTIMERWELEPYLQEIDKGNTKEKKIAQSILTKPDRQGPDANQRDIENETGARSAEGIKTADQWDIYEAFFPFNVGGKRFHIIEQYHLQSETPIKRVFNWLPDNELPYIASRFGSDGERSYGMGYCEMLADYQEEVSAIHNRRGDASTLSNTNLIRAGSGTQLDSNFSIFPNALITGEEGSIETIPLGRNANETIKDEQQTLNLATDRAGVGPSSSGAGSGSATKKGQYTAMGAFPILQEGNTRANLTLTEFRTAHYTLGRKKLLYDSVFGVSAADLKSLGQMGKFLQKAMQNVRDGRIHLPIRAATGSVNKEVEKQNLMLLLNNNRAHLQLVGQLLQGAENPMAPPEYQHFLWSSIQAATALMEKINKEFGIADPGQMVPEVLMLSQRLESLEKQIKQSSQQQPGAPQLPASTPPGAPAAGGPPQLPPPQGAPPA